MPCWCVPPEHLRPLDEASGSCRGRARRLTPTCNSRSRGSDATFWLSGIFLSLHNEELTSFKCHTNIKEVCVFKSQISLPCPDFFLTRSCTSVILNRIESQHCSLSDSIKHSSEASDPLEGHCHFSDTPRPLTSSYCLLPKPTEFISSLCLLYLELLSSFSEQRPPALLLSLLTLPGFRGPPGCSS